MNYLLTVAVERYRHRKGDSYETFNDIIGALDNVKDEFRRRVVHGYEDIKMALNGDVYDLVDRERHQAILNREFERTHQEWQTHGGEG